MPQPRIEGYSRHYWMDFLTIPVLCFAVAVGGLWGCTAKGGEKEEAEATAALALAQAKRERESAKAKEDDLTCLTDLMAAGRESDRTGKPIVVWSGIQCKDYPELRRSLKDAIHCHISHVGKRHGKALVILGGDGNEYFVKPENLTKKTADKVREKWKLPHVPPIRNDVRISEEISFVPHAFGWRQDVWQEECTGGA